MAEFLNFERMPLFSYLPPSLKDELLKIAKPVTYADGQTIHERGDKKPGLSIVLEGAARMGNFGLDGRFHAMALMPPGHCFGESTIFANLPRTHHALAVGRTVIGQVDKSAFDSLMAGKVGMRRAMLAMFARRLHTALEFADDLRSLSRPVHLAKLLLTGCEDTRGAKPQTLSITQDDLAGALGLTRVSINSILKELEKEGLIKRGYGKIEVQSPANLRAWVAARTQLEPLDEGAFLIAED